MTTFSNSPNVAKGSILLVDPATGKTLNTISLQYNPESLSRSYEPQRFGDNSQGEALRYKGPAVETLTIEAEVDAADQLEKENENALEHGIQPQLALLESLINPTSEQLNSNNILAASGTLEIAPMQAPLALFVWSQHRIVGVSFSSVSITEQAFDTRLNPILAKVSLTMKVLSINDLGFNHKGGSLFMNYLQNKERLAVKAKGGM